MMPRDAAERFGREMSWRRIQCVHEGCMANAFGCCCCCSISFSTASSPRSPQAQDSTRERESSSRRPHKSSQEIHFDTHSPARTAANINHYDNKMLLLLHPERPAWPTTSPRCKVWSDVCAVVSSRCRRKKRDDRKPDQKKLLKST